MAELTIKAILADPLSKDQTEIIKAVLYFDVFNYPLTREELFENSASRIPKAIFNRELDKLLEEKILRKEGDFILGGASDSNIINKRMHGNAGAKKVMPLAYKYSLKIARFPFVEGVCLSGGLSKNYYDEKGDIDFFIITKPERLWICRTLLILRFKLLPKSRRKYWCTNYFISSDNLHIPDRNIFTGTELAYLIPTVNYSLYQQLLKKNSWYKERFPNKMEAADVNCSSTPRSFLKLRTESLLGGGIGKRLDDLLLYITLKHWKKKYVELAEEDFELQFRSRKNVCKRHTKGFQNKVLDMWEQKQQEFEHTFKASLR